MQEEKVRELLVNKFSQELVYPYNRKILFWYDESGNYSEFLENSFQLLSELNVKILKIKKNKKERENNIFDIKYTLEHKDKESNYIIYSPYARPKHHDNLLLDVLLYSDEFIADEPSMIIEEFDFDKNYRDLIKNYKRFFDNQERKKNLKQILPENPKEKDIEIGMLAVLSNTKTLEIEEVLKSVFIKGLEENKYYKDMNKYCDEDLFWSYIEKYFGLEFDNRTLKNLFETMLIIHMYYTIKKEPPINLDKKAKSKAQSVYVFIDHWMNNIKDREKFMELSLSVEKELNILNQIQLIEFDNLVLINTFKGIDNYILSKITNYLLDGANDFNIYREWINLRRDISPWDSKIKEIYKVLAYAVEILDISKTFEVRERDAEDIYESYISKYYLIDSYYRKFYENYDKVKMLGIERLEELRKSIEKIYINKLQRELLGYWDKSLDNIKDKWQLVNYIQQQNFYNTYIQAKKDKIFVIISDALRYEVAVELQEKLSTNIESNKVELESMLGTAPSYTRLGMATLLPHNDKIEYRDANIVIDGQDVSSTENREKVLKKENDESIAFQFENLKKWDRNKIREVTKGKEVIYIYHNVIDKVGDERATEMNVFEACRKALEELSEGIKFLVNTLSASNIIVTADHGFIYQRESLENYDKLESKNINNIGNMHKRFLYTKGNIDIDGTTAINMNYIFKDQNIYSIIPKENLRFKCSGGGINFVHGGASLQEVVIPVIKYKNLRNKKVKTSKVNLEMISLSRKIRNNATKFKFIQVEAVNELEKVLPRIIRIGIYDNDKLISNEKKVSLNSKESGNNIDVSLILKAGDYDRTKYYNLRVSDMENNQILINEKYKIDIGISNDFEF